MKTNDQSSVCKRYIHICISNILRNIFFHQFYLPFLFLQNKHKCAWQKTFDRHNYKCIHWNTISLRDCICKNSPNKEHELGAGFNLNRIYQY